MTKPQRGLGKGLGALLGNDIADFRQPIQYVNAAPVEAKSKPNSGNVSLLDIDSIVPNPFQPRVTFDEQALSELAESIKNLGLIQPITVRTIADGKYQIISGERRFRASKIAGLKTMPAYIRDTDDSGMLEMAIVENVQRADLDPIETAISYNRLIEECRLTQEQMADRIGKSRVSVTNFLRLLKLPAKVQYDVKQGNISVGHAKVLLGVEDSAFQESLCDEIIRDGLSVRALEQRIREGVKKAKIVKSVDSETELPDNYYKVLDIVGKYFKNNISLKRSAAGKGTMTIRFDNDAQMDKFLEAITKADL